MNTHVETVRRYARPMQPIPTAAVPKLSPLADIRAVMFDVYGTLLISGSGDVGTVAEAPGDAFAAACKSMSIRLTVSGSQGAELLMDTIKACHRDAREQGVEYPEVDIAEVWQSTLAKLRDREWVDRDVWQVDCERLAIEYEMRANPVWPMPEALRCLEWLAAAGLRLGIVSNAQFFTPILFPALLNKSLAELGFDTDLCFYSYRHGQAKPGRYLFETARDALERLGISPGQVLYIGNDILNDMMPAQAIGFRTALFAGDRRSLRLREGDGRVAGIEPDLVLTSLDQINGRVLPDVNG